MDGQKTIAVDFDGVICQYDGWIGVDHFGDPVPGALGFLEQIHRWGFEILIHTVRVSGFNAEDTGVPIDELKERVADWMEKHGMPYDEIYTGRGKPLALAYVDDRGYSCTPQRDMPRESSFHRVLVDLNEDVVQQHPDKREFDFA